MARNKPNRPLTCYRCGAGVASLTVGNDVRKLRRSIDGESEKLGFVDVDCRNCGHEWPSRHPEAIRLSRKKDASRVRRHKNWSPVAPEVTP